MVGQSLNLQKQDVPRILWSYWHQGIESAPVPVQTCVRSAVIRNPDWDVKVLDAASVKDCLHEKELQGIEEFPLLLQADRIRTALLRRYGGVWVDPTVFHWIPLSTWLPRVPIDGLFTMTSRNPDLVHYWILAGHPGSYFFEEMWRRHRHFFSSQRIHKPRGRARKLQHFFEKRLNSSNDKSVWWARFPLNRFPAYPYFIYCFIADDIIKKSGALPDLWLSNEFPDAEEAHLFFRESRQPLEVSSERIATLIPKRKSPVSKFSHHLGKPEFWTELCRQLDYTL